MSTPDVRRRAARIAFVLLLASAAAVLVGIWTWDPRWVLTAVVLVALAFVFAIATATPRERR